MVRTLEDEEHKLGMKVPQSGCISGEKTHPIEDEEKASENARRLAAPPKLLLVSFLELLVAVGSLGEGRIRPRAKKRRGKRGGLYLTEKKCLVTKGGEKKSVNPLATTKR